MKLRPCASSRLKQLLIFKSHQAEARCSPTSVRPRTNRQANESFFITLFPIRERTARMPLNVRVFIRDLRNNAF